ncbi:peptidylprolyl isomerase [Sphingomonas sp. Leaf407]|uniref:peptidylprolyl isomerase n=1 Tax=unclassified Sphingomonas TaxID=196159 RepID=UPI0006FB8A4F|nr:MULTISPECIES: peptidylprolyl isomerase [unclassified Sphingomonas]KQN34161.1 peptidylprolyl isomerase [Sphingomonas sp. Leaf42]KQT30604.1 peptidylprolyl isomerase [Sphingomonas sp. Leaf407]
MRILFAALSLALLAPAPAAAQSATRATPGYIRVRFDTSAGPIIVALDAKRTPATTKNFLAYVDDGRFDDTVFYRSARRKSDPKLGFVQGGIRTDARRILPPFPHERTDRTGVRHVDGAISMARRPEANSAGGNFVLLVGAMTSMDAKGDFDGYAAFGRVVGGMATVKKILAVPTGGGLDAMKGQMILDPVRILRARRLDGTPRPTGLPKVWLINIKR